MHSSSRGSVRWRTSRSVRTRKMGKGFTMSKTMESDLTWTKRKNCLASFNACMRKKTMKEPASGWPWSSALFGGTAVGCAPMQRWMAELLFSLLCDSWGIQLHRLKQSTRAWRTDAPSHGCFSCSPRISFALHTNRDLQPVVGGALMAKKQMRVKFDLTDGTIKPRYIDGEQLPDWENGP